jgi:hypothetical protein
MNNKKKITKNDNKTGARKLISALNEKENNKADNKKKARMKPEILNVSERKNSPLSMRRPITQKKKLDRQNVNIKNKLRMYFQFQRAEPTKDI